METVNPLGATNRIEEPSGTPVPAAVPFRETRAGWLTLAVVWTVSVVYLAVHLRQGWVPSDAGMLAEMAERVLRGQVPHRNFIEVYTGGLTYLNALAFRLFGVNFFSLRIPLFLFFVGWVPSVYFIARRFARPLVAGAVTLLAVAWSVPNYPEAMPSWYNLFFATWGVLAFFRFTETGKKRWLWIAGGCGGLSFLVKISGLYFVAAGLLFLVFHEMCLAKSGAARSDRRGLSFRLFVTAGLLLYLISVALLISARPTAGEFVYFVLPSGCLVLFLLWEGWCGRFPGATGRFRALLSTCLPFLGGVTVSIACFLLWYASQGALGAWWAGTFIRPLVRTHWIGWNAFSPAAALLGLLPALVILAAAYDARVSTRRLAAFGAPLALAAFLAAAWRSLTAYILAGYSVALAIPLLASAAPVLLRWPAENGRRSREQAFLLVAAAAVCSLIEFPTSGTIYFCYVAPMAILGVLALVSLKPPKSRAALWSLLAFYLIFSVWLRTPGYYNMMRSVPDRPVRLVAVKLARAGGIRAKAAEAEEYEKLVPLVQSHARGSYIYCTPDCPEIYFLSGKRNPTGTIWDFLDPDFLDITARTERILSALEIHGVNVIVYSPEGRFESGGVPEGLSVQLNARFPLHRSVGGFEVRWKAPSAAASMRIDTSSSGGRPLASTAHAP